MRAVADRSKKQSKKEEDVAGFKRETYDILGDYIFTEGEMRQLADSLANKNIEIQGLEDEKKSDYERL
jgi:phage gp45-like